MQELVVPKTNRAQASFSTSKIVVLYNALAKIFGVKLGYIKVIVCDPLSYLITNIIHSFVRGLQNVWGSFEAIKSLSSKKLSFFLWTFIIPTAKALHQQLFSNTVCLRLRHPLAYLVGFITLFCNKMDIYENRVIKSVYRKGDANWQVTFLWFITIVIVRCSGT